MNRTVIMTAKVVLISALLAIAAGCSTRGQAGGVYIALGLPDGGRYVEASSCRSLDLTTEGDRFVVIVDHHQVVIEKERLIVDKEEVAKVPAAAKSFTVTVSNGALTVTADGAVMLTTTLAP